MSKPKTTKKATKKTNGKTSPPVTKARAKAEASAKVKAPKEELVVFAFRLTEAERDQIHKAAGPGKASKFVRTLTVAASKKDETAVGEIVKHIE